MALQAFLVEETKLNNFFVNGHSRPFYSILVFSMQLTEYKCSI